MMSNPGMRVFTLKSTNLNLVPVYQDDESNLPQRSFDPSVNFHAGSQPPGVVGFLRRGLGTVFVVDPNDV